MTTKIDQIKSPEGGTIVSNTNEGKAKKDCQTSEAPGRGGNDVSYSGRIRFGLASVLHLTGQVADRVICTYNSLFSLDDAETAKIYMDMGADFAHDGNDEDAVAALNKVLEMQPDNSDAWFQLGLVQLKRQVPEAAAKAFEKAKSLGNDSFELHCQLAEALADLGKHKAAAAELKRAVELNAESAESFFRLGVALDNLKNYEEAVKVFQRAIDIAPRESSYYQRLGFTFESLKRHEEGIACFKRAVELERRRN